RSPPGSHCSGAKPPSCHAHTTQMPRPVAANAVLTATGTETGRLKRAAGAACASLLIDVASGSIPALWLAGARFACSRASNNAVIAELDRRRAVDRQVHSRP